MNSLIIVENILEQSKLMHLLLKPSLKKKKNPAESNSILKTSLFIYLPIKTMQTTCIRTSLSTRNQIAIQYPQSLLTLMLLHSRILLLQLLGNDTE